jgi:hypothetical protein
MRRPPPSLDDLSMGQHDGIIQGRRRVALERADPRDGATRLCSLQGGDEVSKGAVEQKVIGTMILGQKLSIPGKYTLRGHTGAFSRSLRAPLTMYFFVSPGNSICFATFTGLSSLPFHCGLGKSVGTHKRSPYGGPVFNRVWPCFMGTLSSGDTTSCGARQAPRRRPE